MVKYRERPITVETDGHFPKAIGYDGVRRGVESVGDFWRETGRWWEGEDEKDFYQVLAGGCLIVYRNCRTGEWFLYRVMD